MPNSYPKRKSAGASIFRISPLAPPPTNESLAKLFVKVSGRYNDYKQTAPTYTNDWDEVHFPKGVACLLQLLWVFKKIEIDVLPDVEENLDGSWERFAGAGGGRYSASVPDGVTRLKKALEMRGFLGKGRWTVKGWRDRLVFRPATD